MTVPDAKKTLIESTENKVLDIEKQFRRGFITNDERYRLVVDEWEKTTKGRHQRAAGLPGRVQPHLHDGKLRRPRLHEPESASWPVCAA